LVIWFLMF